MLYPLSERAQAAVRRLIAIRPVTQLLARLLHPVDLFMLRRSGGRLSLAALLSGLPIASVTTTGAKSGRARTVPLVVMRDEAHPESLVLIASNWGQRRYPAWYHNMKAHPEVSVELDGRARRYVAREVSGPDYDRHWAQATARYAGYQAYRERAAGRTIPILVLEPLSAS